MSSCDLRIEFDHETRRFQPGDPVTGRVLVATDKEMTVSLVLERRWRTHGRGNRAAGDKIRTALFEGRWLPGDRHEYPFEFEAPDAPYTYRGHYLNVDWYLRARAEVSWKIDPKTEEEFFVEPPAEPADVEIEPFEGPVSGGRSALLLSLFGLPFFAVGVGAVAVGTAHYMGAMHVNGTPWIAFILGAVFMVVGGGMIFLGMRNLLAQRKLGEVVVRLASSRVRRGEPLDVSVSFSPRSRLRLNGATASLHGLEEVVSGSGTNRTTHTHQLHEEAADLLPPGEHLPMDRIEAATTLAVPAEAPCSFEASDNEIKWYVAIEIDIPGWPDWSQQFAIVVAP